MGSSAVLRNKTHLEKTEINEIKLRNEYLTSMQNNPKDEEKLISLKELNLITNGIIKEKILKKIIQICGSVKDKLKQDDLAYFYSLLVTTSFEAKLNFLLDFIFIKNNKLPKEKYIKKVNVYFENSKKLTDIFLDKNLIDDNNVLSREKVYLFISQNYQEDISNYTLLKSSEVRQLMKTKSKKSTKSNSSNKNKKKPDVYNPEEGEDNLTLNNNNSKEINTSVSLNEDNLIVAKNKKFDEIESEFKRIEYKNNGIFPISLFESMLRDIDIKEEYINIIGNYLRKKTQKSFLNCDLFKEILSLLISEHTSLTKTNKQINTSLFYLISYPKNTIKKTTLIELLQREKNFEINNGDLGQIKNVNLQEFLELCENNKYQFYKSFKNLKYLQYIFFDVDVGNNHSLEYEIINVLLKHKSLTEYILERMQYDKNFYLIDIQFWNEWEKLTKNFGEDRNYNDLRKLRIKTENFCDNHGRIMEGKEYNTDYIVVSELMHELFVKWHGPEKGGTIKRCKIYLDNGNITNRDERSKKNKKFKGYDKKLNKDYELELNPKFIALYRFIDFQPFFKYPKKQYDKELKKIFETANFEQHSRKDKFADTYNNRQPVQFWICPNGEPEKVGNDDIFEDLNLPEKFIVLVDEKVNNKWQSEQLKKKKSITSRDDKSEISEEDLIKIGFYNIGNTCFMNSVLQIFLNIKEIKDIFLPKNSEEKRKLLSFILNSENPEINKVVENSGYLVTELMNLLRLKYKGNQRTLNPRKFKDICGEYNPIFKTSEQQDAHDFYTFLIDKLHEETNINYDSENIYKDLTNSETIDTTELDLANECWANNIRKNASYFYALFMGQLKSTLVCSECNTQKIKFEAFSALELPIPEGKNIIIEIILFRLPYPLRKEFSKENIDTNVYEDGVDIRKKLSRNLTSKTNFSEISFDKNEKAEVINSNLNLNIPLKLKMEIGRKEKCSAIIDKLKNMSDLNIEKHFSFTEFVMISQGKVINEDFIVDSTFTNLNIVHIYELINFDGIRKIFSYDENKKWNVLELNMQKINYDKSKEKKIKKIMTNREKKNLNLPEICFEVDPDNLTKNKYKCYEILIPIIHRYPSETNKNLVSYSKFEYFWNHQDFIILTSENSIKPYDLYEMIWKKYKYFLDSPSNYEKKLWWNNEEKNNSKKLPFIITLVNKDTLSCAICPWFRLCQGCALKPSDSEFIDIKADVLIAVEWDKDVYNKEINRNNLNIIMKHSSADTIDESSKIKEDEISLNDCLKLFTKEEDISDIMCEKCKKKTLFQKTLEIERLPQYLVIVLKRFKYILTNSIKIKTLIKFPLEDLPLQNYVSQKNINYKYSLFGVINHSGSLEWGHYNSIFKVNNSWISYDDSHVSEIKSGIENKNVYMLVYKTNDIDKNLKNVYFLGLMNRAYRVYISQMKFKYLFNYEFDSKNNVKKQHKLDCQFYYGEPVTVKGKRGFITEIKKKEGENDDEDSTVIIKIKIKKGHITNEIKCSQIIKEIYKKPNRLDIDDYLNKLEQEDNNKKVTSDEKEIVCGSRVCNIF